MYMYALTRAKLLQLCPTLCDPKDCSPPGSSVHGILQARIQEWVVIYFSREASRPRDWTCVSYVTCIGRWVLYHWATCKPLWFFESESRSVVSNFCNPMDYTVHGILQARIQEWVVISFSRESSWTNSGNQPRSPALQAYSLLSEPPNVQNQ